MVSMEVRRLVSMRPVLFSYAIEMLLDKLHSSSESRWRPHLGSWNYGFLDFFLAAHNAFCFALIAFRSASVHW